MSKKKSTRQIIASKVIGKPGALKSSISSFYNSVAKLQNSTARNKFASAKKCIEVPTPMKYIHIKEHKVHVLVRGADIYYIQHCTTSEKRRRGSPRCLKGNTVYKYLGKGYTYIVRSENLSSSIYFIRSVDGNIYTPDQVSLLSYYSREREYIKNPETATRLFQELLVGLEKTSLKTI